MLFPFPGGGCHTEIGEIIPVIIKGILCLLDKGIRRTVNGSGSNKGE